MYGLGALLLDLLGLTGDRFKLLVSQARWVAARQDEVRQVSQEHALNCQCSDIVNEGIQSNLKPC